MINDESWVEACEISRHYGSLESKRDVAVHLFKPDLGSFVFSPVTMRESSGCNDSVVCIHPVVYDFLYESSSAIEDGEIADSLDSTLDHGHKMVEVIPLPIEPSFPRGSNPQTKVVLNAETVEIVSQAGPCSIELSCLFLEDGISSRIESGAIHFENFFENALRGRLVRKQSIILISTCFGYALFEVLDFSMSSQTSKHEVFRLGFDDSITMRTKKPDFSPMEPFNTPRSKSDCETTLPGYEEKVEEIMATLCIASRDVAPTAILVSGSTGVGKSRIGSCIANRFQQDGHLVSEISVQDLIFRAMTTTDLYEEYIIPILKGCQLCVVDDLHLLEVGEDDVERDIEHIIVRNSIAALIDQFSEHCRILGISQVPAKLPAELTKVNRLEKIFQINPPTQEQREKIWTELLQAEGDRTMIDNWSRALASSTAGFVAADMVEVFHDASTRAVAASDVDRDRRNKWTSLRDAAHACIPSQLSGLDVVKPKLEPGDDGWGDFAGYTLTKAHIMRNVVLPWRIFLRQMDQPKEMPESWIQPPPGVLFHGPSGCGKTKAAGCLAASLNLPIIHVRAADILDKWLGGSEALLRSLFARARAASPCVLFLDEIDAIAVNREEDDAQDLSSRILSTLLNEMDGVSSSTSTNKVLVVACTNRLKALDAALLRPGRLQEHFHLDLPDTEELLRILKLRTTNIPIASNVTLLNIAQEVYERGGTGADIEGLCREACLSKLQDAESGNDIFVEMDHFYRAMQEIRH